MQEEGEGEGEVGGAGGDEAEEEKEGMASKEKKRCQSAEEKVEAGSRTASPDQYNSTEREMEERVEGTLREIEL